MIPLTCLIRRAASFARAESKCYRAMFARLEQWLCDITAIRGVAAAESGAQGEYAGLLAIAATTLHAASRTQVCLIPPPARHHPASPAWPAWRCGGGLRSRGDVDVEASRQGAQHARVSRLS